MQRICEGCGRAWQIETPLAPVALLRCPYADCRCSFILLASAERLCVERARTFYRQRTNALRKQFKERSAETRADYFLGATLLTMLLSLFGVCHWVGAGWAFFLSLSLTPSVMVIGLEHPLRALSGLGWLYFFSALLVVSALTPSPLALANILPHLALSGLGALFIICVSGVIGGGFYMSLCHVNAGRYARQMLLAEKRRLPRVEAKQRASLPYR